jgi:hypothetical protein
MAIPKMNLCFGNWGILILAAILPLDSSHRQIKRASKKFFFYIALQLFILYKSKNSLLKISSIGRAKLGGNPC